MSLSILKNSGPITLQAQPRPLGPRYQPQWEAWGGECCPPLAAGRAPKSQEGVAFD